MGKRRASDTNSDQTPIAVCGGRFVSDSNSFINRKRCPRFTGTVCAEGHLFSVSRIGFSFAPFLFSNRKEEEKPKTEPVVWARFSADVASFFFSSRLFFCFFSFLEQKRREKNPKPSPSFGLGFLLTFVFFFFSSRLFFCFFSFLRKEKKRKPLILQRLHRGGDASAARDELGRGGL